jgi:hypothetical protein
MSFATFLDKSKTPPTFVNAKENLMNNILAPKTRTLFFEFPSKECAVAFLADLEKQQFQINRKATADLTPGNGVLLALEASFPEE